MGWWWWSWWSGGGGGGQHVFHACLSVNCKRTKWSSGNATEWLQQFVKDVLGVQKQHQEAEEENKEGGAGVVEGR